MSTKILLIEDDIKLAQFIEMELTCEGYQVSMAHNGLDGLTQARQDPPNLLILDWMMPGLTGLEICRRLRSTGSKVPIILVTARDEISDRVAGLDAGADDYVIKPFDLQELLARIRALLRRGNSVLPPVLEWGNLRLDPNSCEVTYAEKLLSLTPKEYGLLELFLRSPGRVLSREIILEHLWSFEDIPGEDTVKTHIKRLRQKLKTVGVPSTLIETVYGLGYRLNTQRN